MHTSAAVIEGVDCPHFFLDYNPIGFYEMTYDDDEGRCVRTRVFIDSFDSISSANWISLGRNFIRTALLPDKPTLH